MEFHGIPIIVQVCKSRFSITWLFRDCLKNLHAKSKWVPRRPIPSSPRKACSGGALENARPSYCGEVRVLTLSQCFAVLFSSECKLMRLGETMIQKKDQH